jgi:hypothetical protein
MNGHCQLVRGDIAGVPEACFQIFPGHIVVAGGRNPLPIPFDFAQS